MACWACRWHASNGSVCDSSRGDVATQREKTGDRVLEADGARCYPEVDLATPTGPLNMLGSGVDDNRDLQRSVFGQSDAEKPRTDRPARVQSEVIEVDFAPCPRIIDHRR